LEVGVGRGKGERKKGKEFPPVYFLLFLFQTKRGKKKKGGKGAVVSIDLHMKLLRAGKGG